MATSLRDHFNQLTPLTDEEWEAFAEITTSQVFQKNELLLAAGQVCRGIFYLCTGGVRTYYLKDGKEINTAFNFNGEFVREIQSLSSGIPSHMYIQALEDTEIVYISRARLIGLYDSLPVFQTIGRLILEQMAVSEQHYASLLSQYSPSERYQFIIENQPELLQRVPLQYLASYLGIARETLSRIRSRMS